LNLITALLMVPVFVSLFSALYRHYTHFAIHIPGHIYYRNSDICS